MAYCRNCWTIESSWPDGGAKFADCGKLKEEIEDAAETPEVAEVPGNEIDMASPRMPLIPSNEHAKKGGNDKSYGFSNDWENNMGDKNCRIRRGEKNLPGKNFRPVRRWRPWRHE